MKSTLFMIAREEIRRVLLHIPLGLLTVLFGYVGWWLAVIFAIGFLVYEVDDDWRISDCAYVEIKGFLWGRGIGGCIVFGLKIGGVV